MISPVYNNLNKIDSTLKQEFGSENVTLEHIERRSTDGTSFDFKFIIESDKHTVKMMIGGREALMMEEGLVWSYYEDPTNEESRLIKRSNRLNNLSFSVREIFDKKMFAKPYLEKVQTEMINESVDAEPILERPIFVKDEENNIVEVSLEAVKELLDNYNVQLDNNFYYEEGNTLVFDVETKGHSITPATMVSIESNLKGFDVVERVWFGGGTGDAYSKLSIDFIDELKPEMYD